MKAGFGLSEADRIRLIDEAVERQFAEVSGNAYAAPWLTDSVTVHLSPLNQEGSKADGAQPEDNLPPYPGLII